MLSAMRPFLSLGAVCAMLMLDACTGQTNLTPAGQSPAAMPAAAGAPNAAGQTIFVTQQVAASNGEILEFRAKAGGNVAPIRTIAGSSTGLTDPTGVAVAHDGRIGVSNVDNANGVVHAETFAANADGNAVPSTAISCGGTTVPLGAAFDRRGNLFITNGKNGNDVTVFAPSDRGCITGNRIIGGSNTTLVDPFGIRIDSSGKIYVANSNGAIVVFAPGATGNVSPIATISGPNTQLKAPTDVAIDSAGELVVTDAGSNSILVFPSGANGNVAPVRSIAGSKTQLDFPNGIALDRDGEMYAVNPQSSSIVVFKSTANGNAAPLRTIAGSATGLVAPYKIAVTP
jgi:sugar lactone lactonase YvrE